MRPHVHQLHLLGTLYQCIESPSETAITCPELSVRHATPPLPTFDVSPPGPLEGGAVPHSIEGAVSENVSTIHQPSFTASSGVSAFPSRCETSSPFALTHASSL